MSPCSVSESKQHQTLSYNISSLFASSQVTIFEQQPALHTVVVVVVVVTFACVNFKNLKTCILIKKGIIYPCLLAQQTTTTLQFSLFIYPSIV